MADRQPIPLDYSRPPTPVSAKRIFAMLLAILLAFAVAFLAIVSFIAMFALPAFANEHPAVLFLIPIPIGLLILCLAAISILCSIAMPKDSGR